MTQRHRGQLRGTDKKQSGFRRESNQCELKESGAARGVVFKDRWEFTGWVGNTIVSLGRRLMT